MPVPFLPAKTGIHTPEGYRYAGLMDVAEGAGTHGYSPQKENYAKRLRRIEGQVRGIAKMIDEDKYCIDVLTQISAVNNALQSVALGLLDEHLGHCVTQAVAEGGEQADAKLAEASAAIARLVRS
jgi:CsoR family transcriptional regulator, copper-sensing transcriptional repressor